MNGAKAHWVIAGMAAIVGALAALLVVEYLHKSDSRLAFGQMSEAGSANLLALMGATSYDATPIVLIDTKTQTILVYEFMVSKHAMYLRCARTYISDRELIDANFYTGDAYKGPSVNDIRNQVRGGR
jgi:hypothetical protein